MKTHAIEQQATAVDIPNTPICWGKAITCLKANFRSKGASSSKSTWLYALAALVLGLLLMQPLHANAQNNLGPPYGAILDLAGQQLPSSWQEYQTTFSLANAESTLTFLLRNDPAFTALNDVSLRNSQGVEMLTHGDFEDGGASWTTVNQYGAAFSGVFTSSGCAGITGGGVVWCDGSVQAYDAISQGSLNLQPGQYTLSFWLNTSNGCGTCDFRDLSNNGMGGTGGNGIDVLAYIGSGPPAPAPEPSSLALLGSGIVGLFGVLRRKLNR